MPTVLIILHQPTQVLYTSSRRLRIHYIGIVVIHSKTDTVGKRVNQFLITVQQARGPDSKKMNE